MRELQKLAHVVWQCKYHVIWCPKYRFKILNGALRKSVGEILQQLCEWKKLDVLEMNVQEDHVHLVLSIPPKNSVSEVVGFLKGKCAIKIFMYRELCGSKLIADRPGFSFRCLSLAECHQYFLDRVITSNPLGYSFIINADHAIEFQCPHSVEKIIPFHALPPCVMNRSESSQL